MSEITRVIIRKGIEGLVRSKGYWSGKEIFINKDESTIYVLNEKITTRNLLDTILDIVNAKLNDWVLWEMHENLELVQQGMNPKYFFNIQKVPTFQRPEWMVGGKTGNFGVSLSTMLDCWQKDGKTPDQLCEFLADEWATAWRNDITLLPTFHSGVPMGLPLARLLGVRWDRYDGSITLDMFLQDLWAMAGMDLSGERFLKSAKWRSHLYQSKKHQNALRDGLRADELELLKRLGLGFTVEGEMTHSKARMICNAKEIASLAVVVFAEKGFLLAPLNLGGDLMLRIREVGMMEPFDRFFKSTEERKGMSGLLISSNIREPKDVPAELKSLYFQAGGRNFHGIRRLVVKYGEENSLPAFDLSPFQAGLKIRVPAKKRMWHTLWFRDKGYSSQWCQFAETAYSCSKAGTREVAAKLKSLCDWALERFESPWDITLLDLVNPHNPHNKNTFAAHCNKHHDSFNKGRRWSQASSLFKRVYNAASTPGFPWYCEEAVNPFEKLENPFKVRGKSQKTHRSRISTLIHERMIEALLDLDEQGKPTFTWAKTQYFALDSGDSGVWCPSRWTALAYLLLLPLRKKSVRWIDQGLMDQKVFDPETMQMIDNSHPLRDYTYEDGQTHLQRYGRPSGAIQQMTDDFMGTSEHIGLFINTNKTQLWNPERRNGYELPWPDGSELMANDDLELRQHGLWLRRVYEVLAYQYGHVTEHDPSPVPVSFNDVHYDSNSVSCDQDCADRMPRFVPLFRDTANKIQLEQNGEKTLVALPVSESKIENAYVSLCMEVERRLKSEGIGSINLTLPRTRKGAAEYGATSRKAKFDIHCLRVAGISRLIEIGIDPVIVQEFVAGQLTPAMIHHYLKMQPWHVREKIIEAIVNGDFKSAMETFAEKVAKGEWDREKTFVTLPRFKDHIANLPKDFACFSVVKGGICVMGGKGDACNEGGVFERQSDGKDTVEVKFGPVQGGCGNCIYFRTAAFMLQEQTLVLNILLAELRAQARERKDLRTTVSNLTCKIDEAEGATEKNRLVSDKSLHEARIEELNHDMVPRLAEWVNRYIMLQECENQLDELMKGTAEATALVAPFGDNIGLTLEDLKVDQEMTPDIGLIGRIVEGSRILAARGIAVPENHARFLERGVDKLLRLNGAQYLLLDVPDGARVKGASIMFNALEDLVGAKAIQRALDSDQPLVLPDAMRKNVNQFAEALVGAAKSGRLTLANILEEGRSCNMISGSREADGRWEM